MLARTDEPAYLRARLPESGGPHQAHASGAGPPGPGNRRSSSARVSSESEISSASTASSSCSTVRGPMIGDPPLSRVVHHPREASRSEDQRQRRILSQDGGRDRDLRNIAEDLRVELNSRESASRPSHGDLAAAATVHVIEDGPGDPSCRNRPKVLDRLRPLESTPKPQPHRAWPKQLSKLAPSRELPIGQGGRASRRSALVVRAAVTGSRRNPLHASPLSQPRCHLKPTPRPVQVRPPVRERHPRREVGTRNAAEVIVVGKSNGSVAAPIYGGLVADLLPDAHDTVFAPNRAMFRTTPTQRRYPRSRRCELPVSTKHARAASARNEQSRLDAAWDVTSYSRPRRSSTHCEAGPCPDDGWPGSDPSVPPGLQSHQCRPAHP